MKNSLHKQIKIIVGGVIALALILILFTIVKPFMLPCFFGVKEGASFAGTIQKIDKVRIGAANNPSNALIDIAVEKKFFEEVGLEVEIYKYYDAKRAFDNMLAGYHDISFPDQSPVIEASFIRNDFKIIASNTRSNTTKIVARRDKNITVQNDLKGKRVNVNIGTAAEYFSDMFMDKYQISKEEIIYTNHPMHLSVALLLSGDIDAIVAPDPSIAEIMNKLGEGAIIFSEPEMYSYNTLLTVRDDFLDKNPQVIDKVLKALVKASQFCINNKVEARALLIKLYNLDEQSSQTIIGDTRYEMALRQSLFLALENEARWRISSGLTKDNKTPDFLYLIHEASLKKIMPQNVNIVR